LLLSQEIAGQINDITGTATVNYLGTARMIRIEVDNQNQRVNAIIDTGAQVTIFNDQIVDQFPSKPYTDRETQLTRQVER
jgi:predicted aspartyl protease